jgi:hypothetical protein
MDFVRQQIHVVLVFYWDWIALPFLLILAWRFPLLGDRWVGPVERFGARFAAHKRAAILAIILATIVLRVSLLGIFPPPVPTIHDEFSYLLAGDTFAHGRLANPPHPMAVYLDTFHVLQRPTYSSMYPPAQGAVLALGERLGQPWIGVVLSMAAMFGAVLWMLQGWFPAEWALLGASLLLLRIGTFTYWMNSYWGGAAAALGGALVMGALPRLLHGRGWWNAILLGLGTGILAHSRPFEGAVVCVPVYIVLAVWLLRRHGPPWRAKTSNVIVPLAATLACVAAFTLYYNWRITGDALLLPHALDDRIHLTVSNFIFAQPTAPAQYLNHEFEIYYNHWQRNQYNHTWDAFRNISLRKETLFQHFFLGAGLTLPFVTLPWVLLDRRTRLLVVQFVLSAMGTLTVVVYFPHYSAPVVATFIALEVQMLRHLRRWEWHGRPIGVGLTRVVALLAIAAFPINVVHVARQPYTVLTLVYGLPPNMPRAEIAQELAKTPGQHLVIVRYSQKHHAIDMEWVYNGADIDGEKVVWARELYGTDMQPLLDYFKGRRVWVVDADSEPPRLQPYFHEARQP